jgi:hypothetical protein
MNLFRSEEHARRWVREHDRQIGKVISIDQLCDLAHAWWPDRLDPNWRPRTPEQNQAILDSVGLTGDFWTLR